MVAVDSGDRQGQARVMVSGAGRGRREAAGAGGEMAPPASGGYMPGTLT
jgi:hypothetical protein